MPKAELEARKISNSDDVRREKGLLFIDCCAKLSFLPSFLTFLSPFVNSNWSEDLLELSVETSVSSKVITAVKHYSKFIKQITQLNQKIISSRPGLSVPVPLVLTNCSKSLLTFMSLQCSLNSRWTWPINAWPLSKTCE